MSTRSRIGIVSSDDGLQTRITSIYCHFDGYPEGVGAVLADHWRDPSDILALLALGDLSILGSELGEEHDFDNRAVPASWCKAYSRDRGEVGVEARTHSVDAWPDSGQEYEYLYGQVQPNDPESAWFGRAVPFKGERGAWRRVKPSALALLAGAASSADASDTPTFQRYIDHGATAVRSHPDYEELDPRTTAVDTIASVLHWVESVWDADTDGGKFDPESLLWAARTSYWGDFEDDGAPGGAS